MLVLISKSTGKPFSLDANGHTLTARKSIKTATVYPDRDFSALKSWIQSSGAENSVDVRLMQSTAAEEAFLELYGASKYNDMKATCKIVETLLDCKKGE